MSLFGSLMRDMENDPIFGHHQRQMNRMVNSMFGGGGGLFGDSFGNSLLGPTHAPMDSLMPFGNGFGGINPFGGFGGGMFNQAMVSDPNSHCFSSSTVMSVSSGPDGRPQVYQASSSTRQAPGGIKETRKTVQDSRTGTKKMEVGRHLGDRGHIREREENMYTGQREENEDFINLDENEAEVFNHEWRKHTAPYGQAHSRSYISHSHASPHLAIGNGSGHSGGHSVHFAEEPHPAYNHHHRGRQGSRSNHEEAPSVTIEELPPSDEEVEAVAQEESNKPSTSSRLSFPSIPRISRRSPHSKERSKKTSSSKRSKKY